MRSIKPSPYPEVPLDRGVDAVHCAVLVESTGMSSSLVARQAVPHPLTVCVEEVHAEALHVRHAQHDTDLAVQASMALTRWGHTAVLSAVLRCALLVAGVGVTLAALPYRAAPWLIVLCGVNAWVSSQVVAAVAWAACERDPTPGLTARGRPLPPRGAAAGVLLALFPAAILSALTAWVAHSGVVLVWAAWGTVLTVGYVLRRAIPLRHVGAAVVLLGGAACWSVLFTTETWIANAVSAVVIIVCGVTLFWWLVMSSEGGWGVGRTLVLSRHVVHTLLRSVLGVASWVLVWTLLGTPTFLVLSWSLLVVAGVADPCIQRSIGAMAHGTLRDRTLEDAARRSAAQARMIVAVALMVTVAIQVLVLFVLTPSVQQPVFSMIEAAGLTRTPVLWGVLLPTAVIAAAGVVAHSALTSCGEERRATVLAAVMAGLFVVGALTARAAAPWLPWLVAVLTVAVSVTAIGCALAAPTVWLIPTVHEERSS